MNDCREDPHSCRCKDDIMKGILMNEHSHIEPDCMDCFARMKLEVQKSDKHIKNYVLVNTTTAIHNIMIDLKNGATCDRSLMEALVNTMIEFLSKVIKADDGNGTGTEHGDTDTDSHESVGV